MTRHTPRDRSCSQPAGCARAGTLDACGYGVEILKFIALTSTALALVPSGAHLLELANKLALPAERYFVVQALYRGWALSGVVVVIALLSTFGLALALRGDPGCAPAFVAFACVIA